MDENTQTILKGLGVKELIDLRESIDKHLAWREQLQSQADPQPIPYIGPTVARPDPGFWRDRLNHVFEYHDDHSKVNQYEEIRGVAKKFAETIFLHSPSCPDQTVALRCVREAVMWANAAVALDGRGL